MMNIAICDDLQEHSNHLHALLDERLQQESAIIEFHSAEALRQAFATSAFDLFFLDIELGGESGIRLARQINARFPHAQIVFVTSNIVHAVDVGEANHTYFLTKPVDPDKLQSALNRVLRQLRGGAGRRVSVVLRGGGSGVVSQAEICYCERRKRTTTIVCENQALATPESLDELEGKLSPFLFARPHNSFLVNLMHVGRLERAAVYLDNGAALSVSNQRRDRFKEALAAYVAQ